MKKMSAKIIIQMIAQNKHNYRQLRLLALKNPNFTCATKLSEQTYAFCLIIIGRRGFEYALIAPAQSTHPTRALKTLATLQLVCSSQYINKSHPRNMADILQPMKFTTLICGACLILAVFLFIVWLMYLAHKYDILEGIKCIIYEYFNIYNA